MSISDLLNSGGGKTFKFDTPGATISGTVVSAEVVQKRNFDTNEAEFWSDGKPVQQIRITLSTTLRDPADPEDTGERSVYVKGWGDQLRTLRAAIRAAGADDVTAGGTFTATYTHDGELPPGKRGFPPKVYEYAYRAPSGTAGLLGDQGSQQAPQPAQQADLSGLNLTPEQLAAINAMQAPQAPQQG